FISASNVGLIEVFVGKTSEPIHVVVWADLFVGGERALFPFLHSAVGGQTVANVGFGLFLFGTAIGDFGIARIEHLHHVVVAPLEGKEREHGPDGDRQHFFARIHLAVGSELDFSALSAVEAADLAEAAAEALVTSFFADAAVGLGGLICTSVSMLTGKPAT